MSKELIKIKGVINKTFTSELEFSAGRLQTDDGNEVVFAGKFKAKRHEPVTLEGHWGNHPKYGRQFKVQNMYLEMDLDAKGLINYLANHPDIKGIGPQRAKKIVDELGADFEEVLLNSAEEFLKRTKLPLETVKNLKKTWEKNKNHNAVATQLAAYDLTHSQINYIINKFGDSSVDLLKSDPYVLIKHIRGFGFKRVDLIARKMGAPKNLPSRIRAGIKQCISEKLSDGHCWTEFQELRDEATQLLVMDDLDSDERITEEIDGLIQAEELVGVSRREGYLVGLGELYEHEKELAEIFRQASNPSPHLARLGNPGKLVDLFAPTLYERQRAAAIMAISYSCSLVSGIGGSGKSRTITETANTLSRNGLSVVLTAPTGKAAKRLEQLGGLPACTLHRLLGYNGFEFRHGWDQPLQDIDVVIVDEVSICSTNLLWQFFSAIDPSRTSVILVGDHNQLPPVGAGNPLRDLIQSKAIPMIILDQCVRQAGALKDNSHAILGGNVRRTSNEVGIHGRRPWNVIDTLSTPENVQQFITNLFDKALHEVLKFDLIKDVQVLTPTHNGRLGTRELNIVLQRLLQKKLHSVDVAPVKENQRPIIHLYDKVIQTRNNYKLGVMNGAVGMVVDKDSKFLTIDFDGHVVEINRAKQAMFDLELAYATTIHRYQGSEVPCAILVVHKAHRHMHHRNLFYTGVTRAQEMAIVVGDHWGIHNCAKRTQVDTRRTFLSLMLNEQSHEAKQFTTKER